MHKMLEEMDGRVTEAEEWAYGLEDRAVEMAAAEQNAEGKMKGGKDSWRELWDNMKGTNIHIIGIPEEEEREKRPEKYLEI